MNKDKNILVEWDRQTQSNLDSMQSYEDIFDKIPTSNLEKLDNFARHVRRQALSKFLARAEIYKKILNIHGSVIDLGVSGGQSLLTWAQLSAIWEPINYTRKIIGFDTFEGIPDVIDKDLKGPNPSQHLKQGGFIFEHKDLLQEVISIFDKNRFLSHIEKVELIKGNICETLPKYITDNPHLVISLLHIDVDTYLPTKVALETCLPRMPRGAIIIFDEINQVPYPGETLALVETIGISSLKIERFSWETGISYAVVE